jgi:transcriptional regulator NrdR family protein
MRGGPRFTQLKCPACQVEGPCKSTDTFKAIRRRQCLACQAIFHTEEVAIIYKGKALSTLKGFERIISAGVKQHGRL